MQASVEFDLNQESGDSDLSETAEVIWKCDNLEESNAFDGPYMDEMGRRQLDRRILAEKYLRPNRGTKRYKIDLIISKAWTFGDHEQLIRISLSAE